MNDYITKAMRTNSDIVGTHGRASVDLTHACLGLVTEVDEFMDATSELNAVEEIGDICWYIALACHAVDAEWPDAIVPNDTLDAIVAKLTDLAKRWFAYGDRPPKAVVEFMLGMIVGYFIDDQITEGQQRNIAKLAKRYPDKFTQAHALHRNLSAEMDALRGNDAPA